MYGTLQASFTTSGLKCTCKTSSDNTSPENRHEARVNPQQKQQQKTNRLRRPTEGTAAHRRLTEDQNRRPNRRPIEVSLPKRSQRRKQVEITSLPPSKRKLFGSHTSPYSRTTPGTSMEERTRSSKRHPDNTDKISPCEQSLRFLGSDSDCPSTRVILETFVSSKGSFQHACPNASGGKSLQRLQMAFRTDDKYEASHSDYNPTTHRSTTFKMSHQFCFLHPLSTSNVWLFS